MHVYVMFYYEIQCGFTKIWCPENSPTVNSLGENSPLENSPISFSQIIFAEKMFLLLKNEKMFHLVEKILNKREACRFGNSGAVSKKLKTGAV